MMRKARLAIRKVNVEEDSPGHYVVPVAASFVRLTAFSLAKEEQVSDNAYQYYGHDNQLLQVFRVKGSTSLRRSATAWQAMTAMMIDHGKRVAAGGARFQWHMIPIADIDLIARNRASRT